MIKKKEFDKIHYVFINHPRTKPNSNKHFPIKNMISTCTPDDFLRVFR